MKDEYNSSERSSLSWEIEFPEAALKTEEFIYNNPNSLKNSSSLIIALSNNLLNWNDYSQWFSKKNHCAILKENLTLNELLDLNELRSRSDFNQSRDSDSSSSDSILLTIWNDKNVIIGVSYDDNVTNNINNIFILCSPQILNFIKQNNYTKLSAEDFWNEKILECKNQEIELRKKFEAFCLLKIDNNKTQLIFMDEELSNDSVDLESFNIDLEKTTPLQEKLLLQSEAETIQLDCEKDQFKVLDYATAQAHPIKEGSTVVGYFIGFNIYEEELEDTLKAA